MLEKEDRPQRILLQSLIDLIKLLKCLIFMGKCLHHFLIADHLLYKRGLLSSCLRLQLEHGKCLFRNEACHKQGDRRDDHDRHRDPHADRQHENQCSEDGHDTGKELGKSHQKSVRELIDIRDNAAYNLRRNERPDISEAFSIFSNASVRISRITL